MIFSNSVFDFILFRNNLTLMTLLIQIDWKYCLAGFIEVNTEEFCMS